MKGRVGYDRMENMIGGGRWGGLITGCKESDTDGKMRCGSMLEFTYKLYCRLKLLGKKAKLKRGVCL